MEIRSVMFFTVSGYDDKDGPYLVGSHHRYFDSEEEALQTIRNWSSADNFGWWPEKWDE